MKTWELHFIKEILKTFILFLLLFYGLYVLIDYASHLSGAHYHHSDLKIGEFFVHYFYEFSTRAEIIIPFGLLIATVHTLTKMNKNSELVGYLAGGYSLQRLMLPYILIGLSFVALLYLNNEFFEPSAFKHINRLNQKYTVKKQQKYGQLRAQSFRLKDNSLLIYRNFDRESQKFLEVYWLPSFQELWRIEILDPFGEIALGQAVDHFVQRDGVFIYENSFFQKKFPEMHFDKDALQVNLETPDEQKLSTLISSLTNETDSQTNEKSARTYTAFYRKISLPWLAFLAVLLPMPFCVRFSRSLPIFLIFSAMIFFLVSIYILFNSLTVLSERQIITPTMAILFPMLILIMIAIYRFVRMRT